MKERPVSPNKFKYETKGCKKDKDDVERNKFWKLLMDKTGSYRESICKSRWRNGVKVRLYYMRIGNPKQNYVTKDEWKCLRITIMRIAPEIL